MTDSVHLSKPTLTQTFPSGQMQIYRAIANASGDAMLIAAPADFGVHGYSITFVNESFACLVGYAPEQIIGQPLSFLATCTAPTSTLTPLWQAIAEVLPVNYAWCCLTQTGQVQPTELTLIPIGDPSKFTITTLAPTPGEQADKSHLLVIIRPTGEATTHEILYAEVAENNHAIPPIGTAEAAQQISAGRLQAVWEASPDANEPEAILKRHARQAEALTRSSQLLIKPAADLAAQEERLQATLSTLLRGLDGEYLALCKFGNSKSNISPHFCVEVVSPELHAASGSAETIPLQTVMHLSPQLLQRLTEKGRATASTDELTTGIHTGTFLSFHLERLSTSSGPWGFITFGTSDQRCVWKPEELWFMQTAVEMIGNVIQRWEAEGAVRAAQASLEQQVQQRTAMLFQTVESLQRQISERKRAEMEVRRRLNTERALRDISARLMKATDFDQAASATLADIGEKLVADKVLLLRLHPESNTFAFSHRWQNGGGYSPTRIRELSTKQLPHLLKHLQDAGFLLLSQQSIEEVAKTVEIASFQSWFNESMLMVPLHVSGDLAALLICCDAERLREDQEEGIHFVQAAVGMLSGMLRIDQMMNALERRVAEQTDELAAFFNMAVLASGSEHATETLAAALAMVKEIGNCDAVCVHIMSPDGAALQLAYQIGLDQIEHRHLLRLPQESTLYQRIARNSTPILITEYNPIVLETQVDNFQSYFGAPMAVRNNIQGLLSCYWRFDHSVSVNQMSLLTALTDQLGIILENQRLHRHAQEVGVVHERQRLARELHDSVTQSMYGVMIFARAAREALEDSAFERLADCLSQVEGASLRSLKEMRLLLYQLRPLALESQGVVEAIRNRVELVERRLGVEVDMQMTPIVGLSHSVEEAIYHVAMESLNNILKHADADRVSIYLQLAGAHAQLRVVDDGVGFEIELVTHGMGLTNMSERIHALGGELHIQTRVDEGTSIIVQIPVGSSLDQL